MGKGKGIIKKSLKKILKINLFISSYIPLYILIYIQEMKELNFESACEVYRRSETLWRSIVIISAISLIFLAIFFNGNHTERENFGKVNSIDNSILEYFITYIIPLNTVDIGNNVSITINLIVFFIIGMYYVESDLMHLNILLIFIGYKVYEDESNNIIISKKDIDYLRKNEDVLCKKIGNTKMYIVK